MIVNPDHVIAVGSRWTTAGPNEKEHYVKMIDGSEIEVSSDEARIYEKEFKNRFNEYTMKFSSK